LKYIVYKLSQQTDGKSQRNNMKAFRYSIAHESSLIRPIEKMYANQSQATMIALRLMIMFFVFRSCSKFDSLCTSKKLKSQPSQTYPSHIK